MNLTDELRRGRELLGVSTVFSEPRLRRQIEDAFDRSAGSVSDAIELLRESDRQTAESLSFVLLADSLCLQHTPLVKSLHKLWDHGRIKAGSDLAKFTLEDWLELLRDAPDFGTWSPVLRALTEASEKDVDRRFASEVMKQVEDAFPTAAIAYGLSRANNDNEALSGTANFLNRNLNFEFGKVSVDQFLKDHPHALADVSNPQSVVRELKQLNRLSSLTPRFSEIEALRKEGLTSADRIAKMGRNTFVEKLTSILGDSSRAEQIHNNASHVSAAVTGFLLGSRVDLGTIPGINFHHIPDWKELFGPSNLCDCSECQSVLSPAAYLTDLLQFLSNHELVENGARLQAIDVLLSQRPDIEHIELTCSNTNTLVPYIDLVNEILENLVAPIFPWTNPLSLTEDQSKRLQTSWSSEELDIDSEHKNEGAYEELLKRPFPWNLPFDFGTEQLRTFLRPFGISRLSLMETYSPETLAAGSDVQVAAECLGINNAELKILNGTAVFDPWNYWGYGSTHATWVTDLSKVSKLLNASELNFADLRSLLRTRFVRRNSNVSIVFDDESPCDPLLASISQLSEEVLQRLHRFVRLWRKLKWSIFELDEALAGFGATDIDDSIVVKVSHVARLRDLLGVSVVEILSWWKPLSTFKNGQGEDAFYDSIFLNRTIVGDETPFSLAPGRTELNNVTSLSGSSEGVIASIRAAIGLSEFDFDLLTNKSLVKDVAQVDEAEIADDALNLNNLSNLFRIASLSRAMDISIRDFIVFRAITGINPFDSLNTHQTLRFLSAYRSVCDAGYSIIQLDYLLRHNTYGVPEAWSDEVLVSHLESLRKALKNTIEDPAIQVIDLIALGKRLGDVAVETTSQSIQLDSGLLKLVFEKGIVVGGQPALKLLSSEVFAKSTSNILVSSLEYSQQVECFRRLSKVYTWLMLSRITKQQIELNCNHASSAGWLSLMDLPLAPQASGQALYVKWELWNDVSQLCSVLPNGFAFLARFFDQLKAPTNDLNATLQLMYTELGWDVADLKFALQGSKLNLLFPSDFQTGKALVRLRAVFDTLRRLNVHAKVAWTWVTEACSLKDSNLAVKALKSKYGTSDWSELARPLRNSLRERQRDALLSAVVTPGLGSLSRWKDRTTLFEFLLLDIEVSSCQKTSRIKQAISSVQLFIESCILNLRNARIPSKGQKEDWTQHWQWMRNFRVWEANRKVFLYPENWILPELRDHKSSFYEDLENELLQDEMTEEKIESAFSRYILKVDDVSNMHICGIYHYSRAFPRLEFGASGYEVEELQNFLNDADAFPLLTVDGVFGHSTHRAVQKFQKKSGLSVDGIVGGQTWAALKGSAEPVDEIHVVGRTRGNPSVYYYRKYQRAGLDFWTPWIRIDQDIDVDQALPIVWNGRPYLFWPVFPVARPRTVNAPETWTVKIAWSELRNGSWQSRKLSSDQSQTTVKALKESTSDRSLGNRHHFMRTKVESNGLMIGLAADLSKNSDVGRESVWFQMQNPYREPRIHPHGVPVAKISTITGEFEVPQGTEVDCMSFVANASNVTNTVALPIAGNDYQGVKILGKTDGKFGVLTCHQDHVFIGERPFFLYDNKRTFYAEPRRVFREIPLFKPRDEFFGMGLARPVKKVYRFEPHYHRWTNEFIERLARGGTDSLMQRGMQIGLKNDYFESLYAPEKSRVSAPYPVEDVDFSSAGSYSSYNWELFFHIPLMIATRFSLDQRFEDAQKWFHYIFDPTDTSDFPAPSKYWRCKPMFEASRPTSIQEWLRILATPDSQLVPGDQTKKTDLRRQIARWRREPFNPHLIARLRIGAYQKYVVMSYLDNLIAWGDQLFRRETMESINEATQIYILASRILGVRPTQSASTDFPKTQTYNSLKGALDEFSNALVIAEDSLVQVVPSGGADPAIGIPTFTLAFCIPKNDKLLGYWDTVSDRLFKIRNCMNIKGIKRQLPLFEPPIDPAILVRATSAGLDIGSVLNELNAPLPAYRFSTMYAVAVQVCNDVRALGSELLSAFEKRDAEKVALLQSGHATTLLKSTLDIRDQQINEATATLESLKKLLELSERKHQFYSDVKFLNTWETIALAIQGSSILFEGVAAAVSFAASKPKVIPEKEAGTIGPNTVATTSVSGSQEGGAGDSWAKGIQHLSNAAAQSAATSATLGAYYRRMDDWELQRDLTQIEKEQIKKQITAAEIRVDLARKELRNLQLQIEQEKEKNDFYRTKFSNQQLYDWISSQLSRTYFMGYQLASDLAKRAEQAFCRDLALSDTNYIGEGYWDSLRKGLLAGERLQHDLNRMQAAYLELSTRDLEIRKNVSLLRHDPLALVNLRYKGECSFSLPEALFDMDFPGHYLRRIKSVSITIPCVTGPMISVNGTLTLQKSEIRINDLLANDKYPRQSAQDDRFQPSRVPTQAIAISDGRNDSGLFELNFRDERYLPFEHAGAISSWKLQLSPVGQFDYQTISDVVMHISYTAKESDKLRVAAIKELDNLFDEVLPSDVTKGRSVLFSIKHRFPTEWRQLCMSDTGTKSVELDIDAQIFPFYLTNKSGKIRISKASIFATPLDKDFPSFEIMLTPPGETASSVTQRFSMSTNTADNEVHFSFASKEYPTNKLKKLGKWTLEINQIEFAKIAGNLDEILLLLEFIVK